MNKYTRYIIIYFKYLRHLELRKIAGTFNDTQLFSQIKIYRLLDRLRKHDVSLDIISFENFIRQELNNVINRLKKYDVLNSLKKILNSKSHCTDFLTMDLNDYYLEYMEIKWIFIAKSKEFSCCIKNKCLSESDILSWKQSFSELKKLFKITLNKYGELAEYFTKKKFNIILINKSTRKDFRLDDDETSSFENNQIIVRLKNDNKESIINIIHSYVDWLTQTFEGFAFNYHP